MTKTDLANVREANPQSGRNAGGQGAAVSLNAFLSTYLPALILALGAGIALPAVPNLAQSFGVSFGVASGVVTAFLIGNLAGAIPSGWLIDRIGARPVLFAGPLLTGLTALLVVFADSFPELLALRFINGFAAQMWLMARLTFISRNAPTNQRGRQVTWTMAMDNSGKLTGPVLGGYIASEWGLQAPFLAYAVFALISIIPIFIFGQRDRDDAPKEAAPTAAPARAITLREIIMPRLVYFALAIFAGLTRGPVQADLLHLYAAFAYHLGPREIGYLATAAAMISWPVGFASGWMMDRFGRKRANVPGFIGVSIAMTALAVTAFAHLGLAWYVTLFLIGIGVQSLCAGSIQTIGADVAPPEARGRFLGLWRFAGQGGAAVSPIIFALLADRLDYGYSFLFIAASAVGAAYLLIAYVPETFGQGGAQEPLERRAEKWPRL